MIPATAAPVFAPPSPGFVKPAQFRGMVALPGRVSRRLIIRP